MGAGGSAHWFSKVFGFDEVRGKFADNQRHFSLDATGTVLLCPTSPWPEQQVGRFETPSVADLRGRCKAARSALTAPEDVDMVARDRVVGLRFRVQRGNVGTLHRDPGNAGAVFQVASQFNCLEMVGPGVTPAEGVAIYAQDMTQGPACAMACPAATVFRNYLVPHGEHRGQHSAQIDTLADVGKVVGNVCKDKRGAQRGRYWTISNGYCLPSTSTAMRELGARLAKEPGLAEAAGDACRVGVHWNTAVAPPHDHCVAQVFCSALPVAYAKSTSSQDWAPFARLVLLGAYRATLSVAACLSEERRGARVRVFLTSLGGGAFGNRRQWIHDAMQTALAEFTDWPLDVSLVQFGSEPSAPPFLPYTPPHGAGAR